MFCVALARAWVINKLKEEKEALFRVLSLFCVLLAVCLCWGTYVVVYICVHIPSLCGPCLCSSTSAHVKTCFGREGGLAVSRMFREATTKILRRGGGHHQNATRRQLRFVLEQDLSLVDAVLSSFTTKTFATTRMWIGRVGGSA